MDRMMCTISSATGGMNARIYLFYVAIDRFSLYTIYYLFVTIFPPVFEITAVN